MKALKKLGIKDAKIDDKLTRKRIPGEGTMIKFTDTDDYKGMKSYLHGAEDENGVLIDFKNTKQFNKELNSYRVD